MDLKPPLVEVASRLAAACERCDAEYALIEGVAAGAYGSDRPTEDVDACVAIAPHEADRVETFLRALEGQGFRVAVEALQRRAARGAGIYFLWLGMVRLDIMLQKGDAYWDDALAGRRRATVLGRELWIASPESLIVLKLAAARDKDWEVVRQIARIQYRRLDLPHLRASARRLSAKVPDLPERVEKVLAEAAEIDRLASLPSDLDAPPPA